MRALLAIALSCSVLSPEVLAGAPAPTVRIRTQDARTTRLLSEGAARSTTLRALVDRIEASHVIVYAGLTPMLKSGLAGRLTWMTRVGKFRYVRIDLSTDLSSHMIIATLAHELQHVSEVIDDPLVVDEGTLAALYRRIGRPSRATATEGWETVAALEAGQQVRRELTATLRAGAAS